MTLRPAAMVLLLCSIAFCQEQKVNPAPAPQAKVVFYRATGYFGQHAHAIIDIDTERVVHRIGNFHTWATELSEGSHFIFSEDKIYGRTYTLEGGETYYFRVDEIPPSFTHSVHFRVLRVSAEVADAEMWGLEAEK